MAHFPQLCLKKTEIKPAKFSYKLGLPESIHNDLSDDDIVDS